MSTSVEQQRKNLIQYGKCIYDIGNEIGEALKGILTRINDK